VDEPAGDRGGSGLAPGWQRRRSRGAGPFVTLEVLVDPDGRVATWESRRHRKHPPGAPGEGSTWWAPHARGWWIGVLFAIGSACFVLGSVPAYAQAVGLTPDALTYFVGSVFFTSAAFLQYREAVDAAPPPDRPGRRARHRVLSWQPGRIDWWASAVQLIGTLLFNRSTGNALRVNLSAAATRQMVWRPDAVGSVCFLVASGLAWFEVCHGPAAWRPRVTGWWITLLNLTGSVAFGVSAVAAFVVPSTGQPVSAEWTNLGTLIGAVCFFAGAVLLLPERTEAAPAGSSA